MKKLFSFIAIACIAMTVSAEQITVAQALQIAGQLEQGATTAEEYEVVGYVTAYAGADAATDGGWSKYSNQIFWIADKKGTAASNADGALEIYQGVPSEMVYVGDKVSVKATLTNYNGLLETTKRGVVTILEKVERPEQPAEELTTITAAEALEKCQALAVGATEKVAVLCYVASIKTPYDSNYGNVTVWLNDDPTSTYGDIQAYRAKCSAEDGAALKEHDKVLVVGNLSHTTYEKDGETKHSYQIAQGAQLTIKNETGVENIALGVEAKKVMMDGVVYIVRDNKLFNLQGVQIR